MQSDYAINPTLIKVIILRFCLGSFKRGADSNLWLFLRLELFVILLNYVALRFVSNIMPNQFISMILD